MRSLIVMTAIASLASPALAQKMNAEEFLTRANKLKAKGPLALFSKGEIQALTKEGQAAGAAAAAQRKADAAAGRPQRYCPPGTPQSMNSNEFMTRLTAIPITERRRIDMTEATIRLLAQKYPCR